MQADINADIAALGPRFTLPLEPPSRRSTERSNARARPRPDDETTRLIAVMLVNAKLAINLLRDLVIAQRSGKRAKIAKVRNRLDRVLAAAQARAMATCNS
jgi:hypothetical protein